MFLRELLEFSRITKCRIEFVLIRAIRVKPFPFSSVFIPVHPWLKNSPPFASLR
jgi:hypothetical protein